jgi:hypothetical protein
MAAAADVKRWFRGARSATMALGKINKGEL